MGSRDNPAPRKLLGRIAHSFDNHEDYHSRKNDEDDTNHSSDTYGIGRRSDGGNGRVDTRNKSYTNVDTDCRKDKIINDTYF